ncbi:class I SAM-dependent methyltransferase [Roseibacillus persicicus]|uniref:class I SAM-dependent methyltransferase n=1 Tax=Roseibacillus persicicus TaxID=454148 RepID=UPI00280CDE7A|nr:class I SAM-dependent methyltransferase [Roseibacillus persicicus]MDQ8191143.1 class I SAM-dependent methyltransferase [Roseibacillus persicicus]
MHLPNRPFSYRETPEDLAALRSLLENHAIPFLGKKLPSQRHILNLACGRSDETGLLADLFADPFGETQFTGIDIRAAELDEASARWSAQNQSSSKLRANFLNLDASKLPLLKEIPSPTHLAFFRHQNFWNGPQLWTSLFDHALHQLDPEGLLIITSYFDKEHLLALSAMESLGAHLLTTVRNPQSRPVIQTEGKSVDRHLAVFALNPRPGTQRIIVPSR